MSFRTLTLCIIFFSVIGCKYRTGVEAPTEKKLIGPSGPAVYSLSSTGEVLSVMKEEYVRNENLRVLLFNDTIPVGGSLSGYIFVNASKFKVNITEPIPTVLVGGFDSSVSQEFDFKMTTKGEFSFKGEIVYDSIEHMFEYRFIVI